MEFSLLHSLVYTSTCCRPTNFCARQADMSGPEANDQEKRPAFLKVASHIRNQIRSGELAEHAALPSERTIGERFGISRMTARRALIAVEMEGLAYSAGRRGRFVSPKRLTYDISRTVSLTADVDGGSQELEVEVLAKKTVQADGLLAEKLRIDRDEALFEYTRLFLLNGLPAFIEVEYVVAKWFPGLFNHDLQQSTTLLLERAYGTQSCSGDITIRMRALQEDEARHLGLPTYHAGIELEQVICDATERPFCYGRQIWRGELAKFTARALVRGERPGL
ncbi:GntR family transcriptional regulator [Rhodobacteraceae bacterium B1Z28]|uniref:GntR family transcriptional regulator n=1 Tax=Ruegeria haliotis TaxID=2747601 RepID=A0ABX2PUC8_9RHOB|nr:GntR family transcriptional regulator [Ruegeria haliotis]NVO56629.1 GntR family transcriptional regulator [Ruegeria haliotis]